jgi:archaellum component FlaG (FlaF/FlaG flagellin family)
MGIVEVKKVMRKTVILILAMLGISLGVIFLYAFLHEGGHALLVLLFGGTVTEFEVDFFTYSPHISYIGISNPMQRAFISLGGPLLPLILVLPLTLLLRRTKNLVVQGTSLLLLGSLLPTLLVSVGISLAYGFGSVDASEDVARFLFYSGFNPFMVAGAFLILFVATLVFLLKVGRVKDVYVKIKRALRGPTDKRSPMLVARIIVTVVVLALGTVVIRHTIDGDQPVNQPLSYHTRIDVDLQDVKADSTFFHTFAVEDPTVFDFVYSLDTHSDITLRLVNVGGEPFVFNNQDSIVMYQGRGSLSLAYFAGFTLLEGDYALEVSPGGLGSLTMYIDSKKPDAADQQYFELLTKVNDGSFTAGTYSEEGYELIYQGELAPGLDQILVTVPGGYERKVSAFVVGEGDVTLLYVADGETHTLLEGFKATMGRGLQPHKGQGELRVNALNPSATLYIYLKED